MDNSNFLENFKEAVEIEDREIQLEDEFRNYEEWDSLANLSVIAMIDDEYGVVLDADTFAKANTLRDLIATVKSKQP